MKDTAPEFSPKIVLGVGAHPDDLDFGAGGSMAKWAAAGTKVYYLLLTGGGKGTSDHSITSADLIATRRAEQEAAGKVIGLADIFFADFEDGSLENTAAVRREIVRYIRQVKPDTVVSWDPTFVYSTTQGLINHPDHRATGQATLDAVYPLARDHLSFPELMQEGLAPHNVATVLLQTGDNPNYVCDITAQLETKLEALRAHASQMNPKMLDLITDWARAAGRPHHLDAAETFARIDLRF